LAPEGELLVVGVSRHHRIEVGLSPIVLRAQDPAEPLGFFLAAPKGTRNLYRYDRLG